MARRPRETFECRNCGEPVRTGARSCPECGSDAETGWSDDTIYDGLDLPDPGYGEDQEGARAAGGSRPAWTKVAAALLLLAIAGLILSRLL